MTSQPTPMTQVSFEALDIGALATATGRVAVVLEADGTMDAAGRRINKLTRGALARLAEGKAFSKLKQGGLITLAMPTGMAADAVDVLCLSRRPSVQDARKAGAALAKVRGTSDMLVAAGSTRHLADLGFGLAMRDYEFNAHKSDAKPAEGAVRIMCGKPDEVQAEAAPLMAVAEGAFFTRDLVNEPANVLTTTEFANRLEAMKDLGLEVEILDEDQIASLGMGSLLCVGQGSDSPSKVVVMQWNGGTEGDAPLALIGKGVVFDTGGISLKPAAGMEDMTMDMGGAGVVAGVMRALARRKAQANVVGLVGLVENMPSGNAVRPGDVVKSMKGDTIEVINTDAEGRLVLCDVMWYAQERFKPAGMIDLATLTGAIIIGLGHENAGVFSNDDALCNAFLKSAAAENEGAWRMPLGQAYDDQLKSRIADMKNVGGRPGGSITAAQFLKRFVKDETPWIHLDIAGVASVTSETALAPKGATGWGVAALNRLVADKFESE
ncbi:leucyl aminopeptidase [Pseudosulfitobacter pseudonitzschiae]|uniref:leucyl aminopeptidase n=1 Tax=Pseudosulfitobacter pseudonitzschiae TaxID=1402135 RepID=UPI001AF58EF4|nr:leucyl aminopeptidase [Pseudosulfitobacter pseudonitzschiae]MBM1814654.1 leucyl aminopeptidase [Pseudosulfitobacter pseudonitzschiae]MBM1831648.1 leucyl aminopeptidase [Pseudosulfitobacter pseudonitzschiae]MBM1836513.1 leucyl aminopeptidase [Pseudosulfitobacter pseudonitzschiae]MBM1841360.1 leucyl aminopeptidase [Pseudosulfitobacter pseudonitzschiae]MBM1846227.1 leucyl aminopeptidase [Pseudosulfitobacter pseudonitzschiae]